MSDNTQEVLMAAFEDEMSKIAKGGAKYLASAAAGGGLMWAGGRSKKMYRMAKKEEREQAEARQVKRMQALQARMALRKQYGSTFSEN